MVDERQQQLDWRGRLNFYNTVFGVLGGLALLLSLFLWLKGQSTLLYFSGFASGLFLFLWMLDFVLKSNNSSIESIGGFLHDYPRLPAARVEPPIAAPPVKEPERLAPIDTHLILETLEQRYEIKKLEPNLIYSGSKLDDAHEGEHGVIIEGAVEGTRHFRAAFLSLHNRPHPKRRIGSVDKVSAQLVYSFFDGSYPLEIHHGAWLSEKDNKVDFGVNIKRNLIVAILEGTDEIYTIERDFDGLRPEGFARRVRLIGDLFKVRIRLIAESDGTVVNFWDMMLEVFREPDFRVELMELHSWKYAGLLKFQIEAYKLTTKSYEVENEEQIAGEVEDWEARAAGFLEKHFSEQHKSSFLTVNPTIEMGLKRAPKMYSVGGEAFHTSLFWTIQDSINARIAKLEGWGKTVYPSS